MIWLSSAQSYCDAISGLFRSMANAIDNIPLLGSPLASPFRAVATTFSYLGTDFYFTGLILDNLVTAASSILSWDTIYSYIIGRWSWLNNIDDRIYDRAMGVVKLWFPWLWYAADYIWGVAYNSIIARWSWVNDIEQTVWNYSWSMVKTHWSWLDSIDDKIINTITSRWTWFNTIDDKIRDVAWNHIMPRLGSWLLDWLMLNLTVWAKIGYRVLDAIWDMEWDEDKKEVK